MNNLFIDGHPHNEPELRTTRSGRNVCTFLFAVERKGVLAQDGTQIYDYIPIIVWDELAATCHRRLRKGTYVELTCHLQSRSWNTKFEGKKFVLEAIVDKAHFFDTE